MMAWEGCSKYGMQDVAERFAYRWLYTITKSFVDFNGVVPEKFDVVNLSHKLDVEYGSGCAEGRDQQKDESSRFLTRSYSCPFSILQT